MMAPPGPRPFRNRLSQFVNRSNPSSLAVFVAVAATVNALAYAVADQVAVDSASEDTAYNSEQSSARTYGGVYSSVPPTDPALCPRYGCPLLPRDIAFDTAAKEALESIRSLKAADATADADGDGGERRRLQAIDALDVLRSAGGDDRATLTLVGYKGGKMDDQVNQDRAFVVSPFRFCSGGNGSVDENPQDADKGGISCGEVGGAGAGSKSRLLGVFDGHGKGGEFVSDHATTNLPQLLATKLEEATRSTRSTAKGSGDGDDAGEGEGEDKSEIEAESEQEAIKRALFDTFVEIDRTAPSSVSGGCTATVVLQLGKYAFVANAGDSRSFLATYVRSTGQVDVIYATREDKPDLPDERERVERMGGRVYIPDRPGRTSRVMYRERFSGAEYGLAMSRSLGDWDAGKVGVIPDPIVDAINLENALLSIGKQQAAKEQASCVASETEGGKEGVCTAAAAGGGDVEVFAVSATDGLLDFIAVEDIVHHVATGLYVEGGPHPLNACEALIGAAATGWNKARKGRYRDDIAIAVAKLDF